MTILSLNLWGGKLLAPLEVFLRKQHHTVDVFCFQETFDNRDGQKSALQKGEMYEDLFSRLAALLPDHRGTFLRAQDHEEGLSIFTRKNIRVMSEGTTFVYRYRNAQVGDDPTTQGRMAAHVRIDTGAMSVAIINFHGLWLGMGRGKGDCPERFEQFRNLREVVDHIDGPKILCGDFNLSPDTECMKRIEGNNMRNLITEYGITSTRSSYYEKENKFADYMLVSPEIVVNDFFVLPDEVSDHLALRLSFDVS